MAQYQQYRQQSRKAALCGMMAALSVVSLAGGSLLPLATFACLLPALACQVPVVCTYGTGTALLVYGAVSVLALLLCGDREAALLYLFLGWYPSIRSRLDPLPRLVRTLVKCGLFTLAVSAMYAMALYLFQMAALAAEFAEYTGYMVAALLVLGNVTFLLFDELLRRLTNAYRRKRRR